MIQAYDKQTGLLIDGGVGVSAQAVPHNEIAFVKQYKHTENHHMELGCIAVLPFELIVEVSRDGYESMVKSKIIDGDNYREEMKFELAPMSTEVE